MRRITPALGHIKLDKLQPHHILSFYENLQESGIRGDTKYTISTDLKALIKERGFLLSDFASRANIAVGTLRACTRGGNTTMKTAKSISEALDMTLSTLFIPVEGSATLSGASVLYHHRVLSTILTTAVHWQIVQNNPCNRIKPPRAERKEAKYLDETQAAELIICLEKEALLFKTAITLLLYSGYAPGRNMRP